MVDTVNEAPVWPVNADGEIVVQAGQGGTTVVDYLSSSVVPHGTTGVVFRLPDAPASIAEGEWTPLDLETDWVAESGFADPAFRIVGTTVQVHFVVAAGATSGGVISILPIAARPTATVTATVFGEDGVGNDTTLIRLSIATTGEITVENITITGDEHIYANFSFPLNLGETPVTP